MTNMRVMVVEDNEIDLTVITTALVAAGIEFKAVSKSTDALQVALEYKPSIAILDMNMPELSGRELQEQLRMHPETTLVKIIFLSASESIDDVVYGLNLQASAYFKKGVRIGQVISNINAIDGTSRIRSSLNDFASYNKRIAEKYSSICSRQGGEACGPLY
tara:strand:- start:380 stop:862 length:483 start_codon:yes stop_codon:yes gene_type:complete